MRPAALASAACIAAACIATAAPAVAPGDLAPVIVAETWLNSEPLSADQQRGAVILVEFWTFACWNCRNVEPHVREWYERYAKQGLRVVAVHTPELERERKLDNVRAYLDEHEIHYPVAIDNDFSVWKAFGVHAWPSLFLIGRDGRVRYSHVGEGAYTATEDAIRKLLAEKPVASP